MSIPMNSTCIACRVERITNTVSKLGDDAQTTAFLKAWMAMAAAYPADMDSARCGYYTDRLIEKFYGVDPADAMQADKKASNAFVLERIGKIRSRIQAESDPVFAGLQYAVLGNYLDFAALAGKVSYEELDNMLDTYKNFRLDRETVTAFAADLERAKNLLIFTDNAGEIVFDRVLAEVLQERYPQLTITFCVRGKPVANDATREDAREAGIEFPVIDSGNAVGGMDFSLLSPEAEKALKEADVILAKGMGNTESMFGCGYNVYYAFLVKCKRFEEVFRAAPMQAMFVKERRN